MRFGWFFELELYNYKTDGPIILVLGRFGLCTLDISVWSPALSGHYMEGLLGFFGYQST